VNILQQVIMMSLRLLIRAPLMLVFAVIIAIRINAGLASIIAVAIPVLAVCIFVILRRGLPFFEKMQRKLDKVNAVIQENLVNVRVVKSFVREDFEKKKFGTANNELQEISVKASGLVVLIMPVMQLVMNISIVAIIWFGGNKIISGSFQVGQLMSFITYVTQILMSLMMLSMTIMTFSRSQASSERILEVLNTKVDIVDSPEATKNNFQIEHGKIEFKKVSFKYHTDCDKDVLKNISLTIHPGETVAIIGATGSSKSTLVQLIPRLYDVTAGDILIDGKDIHAYTLQNLRTRIKMVLQNNELFSGTIKQNLKWGKADATDVEIITAAKDAQAHNFIMSLPKQYETVLGQGGVNVSGGQKQRLCLARAIIQKPAILILDDSTSAIDTATEAKIRESFSKHLQGTTTLIIEQRISSIQSADRIIVLDDGEIIGAGTHAELMKNNQVYREIYNSQQLQKEIAS
jgi:ATP-binding cassette subfamily B protein